MYQSLATVNVSNFVTLKLFANKESDNYSSWKMQLLSLIESHDLLGFIDGTIQPPPNRPTETTDPAIDGGKAYDVWRTDKVLKGWILGTISEPGLLAPVSKLSTAREVCLYLEDRFQKKVPVPGTRRPTESQNIVPVPGTQRPAESQNIVPVPGTRRSVESQNIVPVPGTQRPAESQNIHKDLFNVKMPLLQAALNGNWEAAQRILDSDPEAAKTSLNDYHILEVAVGTGKAIPFVEKLLQCIPDESIALKNHAGATALHIAAAVDNKAAAMALVRRMPELCYISNNSGNFPIQWAAQYAKRNTLEYLISVTRDDRDPNPYASTNGVRILMRAIDAEFFDIAIGLVKNYPYLAGELLRGQSALGHLTKSSVLSNKRLFSFWERFILSCLPATTTINIHNDIESKNPNSNYKPGGNGYSYHAVCQKLNAVLWKILERLVPHIRTIKEKSRANEEALILVKLLCNSIKSLGNISEAKKIYETAFLTAATSGARDVVEAIMDVFPASIYARQFPARHSIFHLAVENRSEDVFNLIYQMSDHKHIVSNFQDTNWNNLLHLAGKLAPPQKLNEISGEALQMQREVQWFEEVEKFVHPSARGKTNNAGKTPKMLFIEEHKSLKEQGDKWMKETANSCTISAALIATVMFAAAITVPGGNDNSNGYPFFSSTPTFIIFAVSDAISLFASATALLFFLAILTSRYKEEDFSRVLPKRLIFGLGALFLSITSMTVSFGATVFLVFGKEKLWVLFPVLLLSCFPIASFDLLQFPLLVDLISSTYGSGIFGKKSNRPFF